MQVWSNQVPRQAQNERMYTIHGFNPFVVSLNPSPGELVFVRGELRPEVESLDKVASIRLRRIEGDSRRSRTCRTTKLRNTGILGWLHGFFEGTARPDSSRTFSAMSGAVTRASPTSTALTFISASRFTCSRELIPLSLTMILPLGTNGISPSVTVRSVLKVCKSRLL